MKKVLLIIFYLIVSLVVRGQATITLDASQSRDPDGTIQSYKWEQVGQVPSNCVIANPAAMITTVKPANGEQWKVGVYTFRLTITDNLGAIATDDIKVTVVPNPDIPPNVNAGNDFVAQLPFTKITLTSLANDPDGTVASYSWGNVSGPTVPTIVSPNAASTDVTGLIAGIYKFRVKVTDDKGASVADTIQVTVKPVNQPPVPSAGADQTITLPVTSVTIGLQDQPGLVVQWIKSSGPSAVIEQPNNSITKVSGLVPGNYVFVKTVMATNGTSVTDEVRVTVKAQSCSWFQKLFHINGCRF